jgi:hypothetical protein
VQQKINDISNDDARYHDEALHEIIQRYHCWLGAHPIPLTKNRLN